MNICDDLWPEIEISEYVGVLGQNNYSISFINASEY